MHERIAKALLIHTGYDISAAVSRGKNGEILFVSLFDTIWQAENMEINPEAAYVDLISHHPQGQTTPYDEDIRNLQHIAQRSSGKVVRLFVASEYFSCREIAL